MNTTKKIFLGAALLLALGLGALSGTGLTNLASTGTVSVAYAADCEENYPPPPGVEMCPTATPTPRPPQ